MNKKVSGLIWKILQQYSSTFIRFVIQIILARILMPSEYGIIAEISVFITVADVIANSAFGTAIVRKQKVEKLDYSTAFVGSIFLGIVLYLIIYFFAPGIAKFYGDEILIRLLRIYGITIFFSLYLSILNAKILKKYNLKENFLATFIAGVVSGTAAIVMAYIGLGVWSLVVQNLLNSLVMIIVLQVRLKWFPGMKMDVKRLKEMFSFSWKYLIAMLLGNLLENVYNLSIGRYYGKETLGQYNRGNSFPSTIIGQLRIAVATIMLPAVSEKQDDELGFKYTVRMMTHFNAMVMFPLSMGLALVAEPMVILLLTEKWAPCVFFVQIECVFYAALAISSPLETYFSAIGKSGVFAVIEAIKLLLSVAAILTLHKYGIYVLCVVRVIISLLTIAMALVASNRYLKYSLSEIYYDIKVPLFSTLIMSCAVYLVGLVDINMVVLLLLQIIIGVLIYSFMVFIWMKDDIRLIKHLLTKR